ncbi:MAG TPA: serine/threonine-protein kinase, partial [Rectinemataceae bacterium]
MKQGEILGSYILETELGRRPSASTWLARRVSGEGDRPDIVLKILDLSETSTWGAVDVFRRECEALKRLSHPSIPLYLENFEAEADGKLRLVLAMERIEGQNLEAAVAAGKRFSEAEVEDILAQLSSILAYLGSLRPPLVHRDINPKNIVLRPNGSIALVDFSGVQDAVAAALYPGATMVGTAGYMPLEQVAGRASHRSDLYGAAATALFLLTGRNPAELPTKALKVDISGIMDLSPRLDAVLSSWLEPDVELRKLGAAQAAGILRGEIPPSTGAAPRLRPERGPEHEARPTRGADS